MVCAH